MGFAGIYPGFPITGLIPRRGETERPCVDLVQCPCVMSVRLYADISVHLYVTKSRARLTRVCECHCIDLKTLKYLSSAS